MSSTNARTYEPIASPRSLSQAGRDGLPQRTWRWRAIQVTVYNRTESRPSLVQEYATTHSPRHAPRHALPRRGEIVLLRWKRR